MKGKKAVIIIATVLAVVLVGVGCWFSAVAIASRKHNLITLETDGATAPTADKADFEGDVELSTGVTMHYARYGSGAQPLLLIHGNGGSHLRLEEVALYFSGDYTVYAPDSRCQGQSTVMEEISYALMAADINAFCLALNIVKPLVIGHSDGGIVALQVAMDYPDLLKGFVSCGANSRPQEFKLYFSLPIKVRYAFNPKPLDRIMIEEPDFTAERLAKITCPAYIVAGEFDIMYLSDTVYITKGIKGAKCAIIKGAGHSYIRDGAKAYQLCKPFFDEIN